ncbi:MAG: hypothetical protein KatS3mg121_1044 [Gammaproteobacteria bacterium]|nr:MAG: hypothetical protein KatS3mg121_1044 [Gammaproteobacteria bacterium]
MTPKRWCLWLCLAAAGLSGCMGRLTDGLAQALLDQPDPETARAGLPAYLLLADGLIAADPDDAGRLLLGAKLYNAYGQFVEAPERRVLLAGRALDYARRAACRRDAPLCAAAAGPPAAYRARLKALGRKDAEWLLVWGAAWAGHLQAKRDDWRALVDLPKVQATFERVVELDETVDHGAAHLYLGVLDCLRPAALGGAPERGVAHFERAIELSDGRHLLAKVLYAEYCARLLFDRARYERLLEEVLAAEAEAPGLTLSNRLAQQRARRLLEEADAYF